MLYDVKESLDNREPRRHHWHHYRRCPVCYKPARNFLDREARVLHAAWRWHSACVEYDRMSGTSELGTLAESVLRRMDRCLRTRDEVHRTLSRRPGNNSADDNAAALDGFLLFLMSAVDATANVAHHVLVSLDLT